MTQELVCTQGSLDGLGPGLWLAQAAVPPGRADPGSVLMLVMVFIGIVIGTGLVIMLLRRRLLKPPADNDAGVGMLASMRAARDRGDMTQEEYEQAKRVLAARAKDRLLAREAAKASAEAGDGALARRTARERSAAPGAIKKPAKHAEQLPPSPDNAADDEASKPPQ